MKKLTFAKTNEIKMDTLKWEKLDILARHNIVKYYEYNATLIDKIKAIDKDIDRKECDKTDIEVLAKNEGRTLTDVEKVSISEIETAIKRMKIQKKNTRAEYNALMTDCYKYFADDLGVKDFASGEFFTLYGAYANMVEMSKNGAFRNCIVSMFKKMGIIDKADNSNGGSADASVLCDYFVNMMGGKSRSKSSMKNNVVNKAVVKKSKAQFEYDFINVLRDLIASNIDFTFESDILKDEDVKKSNNK